MKACLLPPSPRGWVPDGHLGFFMLGLLGEPDLGGIERVVHAKDSARREAVLGNESIAIGGRDFTRKRTQVRSR